MFANVHGVAGVAVVEQAAGDGGGGMLAVSKYAYLGGALNEGAVQFGPGATGERDDAHVVIRHEQTVSQQLQGVERWVEHHLCFRHLASDGVSKAEEQRVAGGEDDNLSPIPSPVLFEDGI